MIDLTIVLDRAPELARGLLGTLELGVLGSLSALVIGLLLTLAHFHAPAAVQSFARGYTALCLGLPLLVVIYLLFYVLPYYGVLLEPQVVGVSALAIYYGPYFAEVMRAAIQALPVGQFEAGRAIGLSSLRMGWRIVLPQALPLMLPSLAGLLIGLVKDTALLSVVSVHEFMYVAKEAVSDTYAPLEIYLTVALIYWALTASMAGFAHWMEQRLIAYRKAA